MTRGQGGSDGGHGLPCKTQTVSGSDLAILSPPLPSLSSPVPLLTDSLFLSFLLCQRVSGARHHRYIFEKRKEKVKAENGEGAKSQTKIQTRLQELGPRFTLKLLSVQKGILSWKHGEFEWCNTQQNQDSAGYNRRTYVL